MADVTNGLTAIPNLVAFNGVIVAEMRRDLWSNNPGAETLLASELAPIAVNSEASELFSG